MILSEPQRSAYDLNFNLMGFPVRVHPFFFVMPLMLGGSLIRSFDINTGAGLIVLSLVFFISILVHELGHALAYRYYGLPARIVLYWMGGLAIADRGAWNARRVSLRPFEQIVVSFAGPAAGFLLAVALAGIVMAMGGRLVLNDLNLIPFFEPDFANTRHEGNAALDLFFFVGLWANIFWNVLNLVPVYPLDGGQICRQALLLAKGQEGVRISLIISIVCCGGLVAYSLLGGRQHMFMAMFFGYMGFMSYQMLQQQGRFGGGGW